MLSRIITEPTGTASQQVVNVCHVVMLEIRVFSIYIRQATHLPCGTFAAVVIITYFGKARCVIQVLMPAYCGIKVVAHLSVIDSGMVRQNVHNHLHAIPFGFGTHIDEIFASTHLIVTYLPVNRLVLVIPPSVAEELIASSLVALHLGDAMLRRRSLHIPIPGIGYLFHVFFDCVERPAPCVQYHIVVGNRFRRLVASITT